MSSVQKLLILLLLSMVVLAGVGCGPSYIRADQLYVDDPNFQVDEESKIVDSTENREVLDVLAHYRRAVVNKDFGSLKRLISSNYYDNAGTTDTTADDYDATHLTQVFEMMAQSAREIRYDVLVKAVKVENNRAHVDYQFDYAYQYVVADDVSWDAGVDVNRLELVLEDGQWRIVSGL